MSKNSTLKRFLLFLRVAVCTLTLILFVYQIQVSLFLRSNILSFLLNQFQALLCKYAFPDCVIEEGEPVGLPLCQQDCLAVQKHFCLTQWAVLEDEKRRGSFLNSRGHFRLPLCQTLPKYTNSTHKTCTRSSITLMSWDLATQNCYKVRWQQIMLRI